MLEWGFSLGLVIRGKPSLLLLHGLRADIPPRNVSEPLAGKEQTNQRAELTGIIKALQLSPKDGDLEILSDSKYSIDCSTSWPVGWMRKGWKTSTGADVKNRDLIEAIFNLVKERKALGVATNFSYVKAHNGDLGNEAADRLAVSGARAPRG